MSFTLCEINQKVFLITNRIDFLRIQPTHWASWQIVAHLYYFQVSTNLRIWWITYTKTICHLCTHTLISSSTLCTILKKPPLTKIPTIWQKSLEKSNIFKRITVIFIGFRWIFKVVEGCLDNNKWKNLRRTSSQPRFQQRLDLLTNFDFNFFKFYN